MQYPQIVPHTGKSSGMASLLSSCHDLVVEEMWSTGLTSPRRKHVIAFALIGQGIESSHGLGIGYNKIWHQIGLTSMEIVLKPIPTVLRGDSLQSCINESL